VFPALALGAGRLQRGVFRVIYDLADARSAGNFSGRHLWRGTVRETVLAYREDFAGLLLISKPERKADQGAITLILTGRISMTCSD
jgi:hypothetical protein